MNTLTREFATVAFAGLLVVFTATAAESLSVLLQKGIYAEETEGNLDAAIKIYEGIVKEGEANRSLVAQAQYRLGMCHLKKGEKEEAVAAFRVLISQFADAAELVGKSHVRLAELGKPASSVLVRQVWSGASDTSGSISPDGLRLSFVDWDTGDLAVRDLKTGQNRRLTDKGSWDKSAEYAENPVFSRDGRRLAYGWWRDRKHYELRVVGFEEPKQHVLLTLTNAAWIGPHDWAPDGKTILVHIIANDGRVQEIALVSASDGTVRSLKSLSPQRGPGKMRFSPSGQHIAYSRPGDKTREADVFLLDLSTGNESVLVEHPADDRLLEWVPDGRGLLVSSNRRGGIDLWFIPLATDMTPKEPVLLKPDLGDISPMGFTKAGAFYYGVAAGSTEIYAASVDLSTGRLLVPPRQIPIRFNQAGVINQLSVSPDGRFLAFEQRRGSRVSFHFQDFESGEGREVSNSANLTAAFFRGPKPVWSADNRHVALRGMAGDRRTLYVRDRISGETKIISIAEPNAPASYWGILFQEAMLRYLQWNGRESEKRLLLVRHDLSNGKRVEQEIIGLPNSRRQGDFALSPDEKHLFYFRQAQSDSGENYMLAIRRDVLTGKELELLRSTNGIEFLGEPNTGRPVMIVVGGPRKSFRALKAIDVLENSVKERFALELPEGSLRDWIWSTRMSHLLFTNPVLDGPNQKTELWMISAETGHTKKIRLERPGMNIVGCHPDGQRLFFAARNQALSEVWALENFLPLVAAKK